MVVGASADVSVVVNVLEDASLGRAFAPTDDVDSWDAVAEAAAATDRHPRPGGDQRFGLPKLHQRPLPVFFLVASGGLDRCGRPMRQPCAASPRDALIRVAVGGQVTWRLFTARCRHGRPRDWHLGGHRVPAAAVARDDCPLPLTVYPPRGRGDGARCPPRRRCCATGG